MSNAKQEYVRCCCFYVPWLLYLGLFKAVKNVMVWGFLACLFISLHWDWQASRFYINDRKTHTKIWKTFKCDLCKMLFLIQEKYLTLACIYSACSSACNFSLSAWQTPTHFFTTKLRCHVSIKPCSVQSPMYMDVILYKHWMQKYLMFYITKS